jgi:hypothetical protein
MNQADKDRFDRDGQSLARLLIEKAQDGVSPEALARQFCADALNRIIKPLETGQHDPGLQADLDLLVEQFAEHFT